MKKRLTTALLGCVLLLCINICVAQVNADPPKDRPVITATIDKFNNAIGLQSYLYNGTQYKLDKREIKGNPNFKDTSFAVNGSLVYDGCSFADVPLIYDMRSDLLVTLSPDGSDKYSFLPEKVTEFNLLGHHFIRITGNSLMKAGFYDEVYANKLRVYVRRTKIIHIAGDFIGPDDRYEPLNSYYLKAGDRFYSIASLDDVLNALPEHKAEMQRYIKENKFSFRTDAEQSIATLAEHYDQLTNR